MFPLFFLIAGIAILCSMKMASGDLNNDSGVRSITCPTGGMTKGKIYLVADSYVVALETVAAGAAVLVAHRAEAIEIEKATGTGKSFVFGDKVYALSNKLQPATATGAVLMDATVLETAATTDTSVKVCFRGGPGLAAT